MNDLSEVLVDPRSDEKFNRLFRNTLKKNHLAVEKRSSRDYYIITDGKDSLGFDISAEKYDFVKNRSAAAAGRLVEKVKRDFDILERLVSFTNGQEFLRYTVMRGEEIGRGMISENFMGNINKVVCYTADDVSCRILDESYMKKWDVPREVLFSVADRNMCRLLKKTEYAESVINAGEEIRCLDFKAEGSDLTVALMMCADFRDYISSLLSPKFLVAAPSKDSLIVLSEVTNNVLERLGSAIVGEYRWASKPLTTDIFLYTSQGVQTAGHFSEIDN
ncbi:MAG: hypothetical protein NC120_03920 [Ruminococcus sp.]|nr:hypothetical protein [Ruminococcus sp.]